MKRFRLGSTIAVIILVLMGLLAYSAAWNDTMITDEDPHIAAGIGYVEKADMRLNPEHPPLVKYLSALPVVLFMPDLNVPYDHPYWANPEHDPELVNGQWEFGQDLIFRSGNDADTLVRLARIAPTLLMLLLGWLLFRWTQDRAGTGAGLLALLLYATSPPILAHGVFVTTDVPAALGIFGATYYFLKFLHAPTRKSLLVAGLAFGLAQLLKFSVVLLVPYFGILAFAWWWLNRIDSNEPQEKRRATHIRRPLLTYVGGTVLIGIIGLVIIYVAYAATATAGYPADRQLADTIELTSRFPARGKAAGDLVIAMAEVPILRPMAQYLLGLFMVLQRAAGGNTTFFMGQVARDAWLSYFPMLYLLKMRLSVHLLTLVAVVGAFIAIRRDLFSSVLAGGKSFMRRVLSWKLKHFDELAMLLFIAVYWFSTLTSNLNIGIRHLSPTLPFVFALIAIGLKPILLGDYAQHAHSAMLAVRQAAQSAVIITVLVVIAVFGGLAAYPHYLSHYNPLAELRGGGVNIAVDSNLDWGQDLKRLGEYVTEQEIDAITINYFGWAVPEYYMPPGTEVHSWWADWEGRPEGWFAVSATFKQQACAEPVRGFGDRPGDNFDGYCFLNEYAPKAIVGRSIYVYNLPPID